MSFICGTVHTVFPKQILDTTSRWFTSISQNTFRLLETQLLWTFPGVHMAQQHVTETNSVFRKNLENHLRKTIFWVEAEGQEWRSCSERSKKLDAVRTDSSTKMHTSSVERWPKLSTKDFLDLSLSSTSKGTIAQKYVDSTSWAFQKDELGENFCSSRNTEDTYF